MEWGKIGITEMGVKGTNEMRKGKSITGYELSTGDSRDGRR